MTCRGAAARACAVLATTLMAAPALAAGPDSPDVGARAVGRAGAVIASADDSLAALAYDPATLAGIGSGAIAGVTFAARGVSFQPTGQTTTQHSRAPAEPLGFGALSLGLGPVTLAAGAYQAAGLTTRYFDCPTTVCVQNDSSFSQVVVPVGVAIRTRLLLVGVGGALEHTVLSRTGNADLTELAGSASLGILLLPGSTFQVAGALQLPIEGGNLSQPWIGRGALRFRRGRLDAEAAASWEGWSSLGTPVQLRDTVSARIGLDLALAPGWLTVRTGWSYERAAMAAIDLSRELPDLDRQQVAVGATACASGMCLDLGYAHAFTASEPNGGDPARMTAGRYGGRLDAVGVSLRADFGALRAARRAVPPPEAVAP
jgi:long-subunit fatty acid transport protein